MNSDAVGRPTPRGPARHSNFASARSRCFRAGAGIGWLKVLFTGPLPFADRQANLMGTNEKKTRKLMNDCYRRAHEKEDADETLDVDG